MHRQRPATAEEMTDIRAEKAKHTVTVFTDIDCGYCRKLHSNPTGSYGTGHSVYAIVLSARGLVAVPTLKRVSVWCVHDRKAAMTNCQNPENPLKQGRRNPGTGYGTGRADG